MPRLSENAEAEGNNLSIKQIIERKKTLIDEYESLTRNLQQDLLSRLPEAQLKALMPFFNTRDFKDPDKAEALTAHNFEQWIKDLDDNSGTGDFWNSFVMDPCDFPGLQKAWEGLVELEAKERPDGRVSVNARLPVKDADAGDESIDRIVADTVDKVG